MKFQVHCPHESLRLPILNHFKSLGVKNTGNKAFLEEDVLYFQTYCDESITYTTKIWALDRFPKITLDEFFKMKPKITFNLNEKYTASFDGDEIAVGCQRFTKETMIAFAKKILEVYNV